MIYTSIIGANEARRYTNKSFNILEMVPLRNLIRKVELRILNALDLGSSKVSVELSKPLNAKERKALVDTFSSKGYRVKFTSTKIIVDWSKICYR